MNTTTALFKKELYTAKWFLLGGVLFFWSFPLLEGTGTYFRSGAFRTDMPSGIALAFGGLFAIITACGMVCMDMPKGLYEFWRSRPVKLLPYMAVKYIVGLAVVLFVITVPILLEMYLLRNADSSYSFGRSILCCHTFIILLLYSVAFCAGHLFGNMTEAAIISFAAALLIYFVPVLVPAMEPLSFFNIVLDGPAPTIEIVEKGATIHKAQLSVFLKSGWGQDSLDSRYIYWMPISAKSLLVVYLFKDFWLFTGTMTALSAVLIAGAWMCLKYHLQVRLGMKSLCWSLGLVALLLFSAAAFSVGSNLNCLAKIPVDNDIKKESALKSYFDSESGVILQSHYDSVTDHYIITQIDRIMKTPYAYRHDSYPLEKTLPVISCKRQGIAWSKQAPDIVYLLETNKKAQGNASPWQFTLYVIRLDDVTHTACVRSEFPVGEYDAKKMTYYSQGLVLDGRILYLLLPSEVAIIDVSDDKKPCLLTKLVYQALYRGKGNRITIPLPDDDTLSEEQRYRIVQYFACESGDWAGDRYVKAGDDWVCVYGLKEMGSKEIQLEKIACRNSLPLEKLMYRYPRKVILHEDIVYLLYTEGSLTVYQLNESAGSLKSIGHYAPSEGNFYDMFLREDGLITLVGNKQIHIVQPPAVKGR